MTTTIQIPVSDGKYMKAVRFEMPNNEPAALVLPVRKQHLQRDIALAKSVLAAMSVPKSNVNFMWSNYDNITNASEGSLTARLLADGPNAHVTASKTVVWSELRFGDYRLIVHKQEVDEPEIIIQVKIKNKPHTLKAQTNLSKLFSILTTEI